MTAFEHSHWKDGFPFSASRIRAGRPLALDGVNAPAIADAPEQRADRPAPPYAPSGLVPAALRPALREGHPVGRRSGMRLLPLKAFLWGSRTDPPQPRTRPDHTLIWVTEGRLLLDFPRDRYRLGAGELRHIPAGTAFAAMPMDGARGHVALISAPLAAQAVPPLPDPVFAARVGSQAARLEATLREIAVETQDSDPETLACLITLLSLRLRRLVPGHAPANPGDGFPDRALIDRFLALARDRMGDCHSVPDLAAELGSSALELDKACLAARGKRAVDLLHDLRLEEAVRRLRETRQPTQRIAAELGYSSHAHFVRALVAATGRTPDVFRAQSC